MWLPISLAFIFYQINSACPFWIPPSTHAGDFSFSKSLKMLWNFSIKAHHWEDPQTMLADFLSPCLACEAEQTECSLSIFFIWRVMGLKLSGPQILCAFHCLPPLLSRVQRVSSAQEPNAELSLPASRNYPVSVPWPCVLSCFSVGLDYSSRNHVLLG